MNCRGFLLAAMITVALSSATSSALPRYSLMINAKCGSCHASPTGGQMRTEYGTLFGLEKIPLEATKDEDFAFSGKLSENISIGGDHRSQFLYDGNSKTSGFQAMSTSIYGLVTLSRKIQLSVKYDIINGTYGGAFGGAFSGTEVYALAKILPGGWYIKGGSFLPEFGWRSDDHTAYVRGGNLGFVSGLQFNTGLIFLPNYKDLGVEVGGYLDDFQITAGVFNGTGHSTPVDFSKDKAYVAKIEYLVSLAGVNLRLGTSGYTFKGYQMGGFTLGAASGDVVFMAEADWTRNRLAGTTVVNGGHAMALSTELDVQVIQGLWFIGKHELFDPVQGAVNDDLTPGSNAIQRVTVGLEVFPFSYVELRPQFRYNIERPELSGNNQYIVQVHCWF